MNKKIFILDDDYECFKAISKVLKFYFPNCEFFPGNENYEKFIIDTENKDYESLLKKMKELEINIYIIDIKFGNDNNPSGIEFLEYLEKELPPNENDYEYILITDGGYEKNKLKKYKENIPFISKSNLGNRATALLVKDRIKKILK